MLPMKRNNVILCILIVNLFYLTLSHQSTNQPQNASNKQPIGQQQNVKVNANASANQNKSAAALASSSTSTTTGGAELPAVDDILNDTIMLLDVLDHKLAAVSNRTPSALMRDNLRALDGANTFQNSEQARQSARSLAADDEDLAQLDDTLIEEALVKLAEGFSSGRQNDGSAGDPLAASSEHLEPIVMSQSETSSLTLDGLLASAMGSPKAVDRDQASQRQTTEQLRGAKRARQLMGPFEDNQLASDSTERHIKFTLDLMQSIFSSQSYSSKTNLIESFLISPLSIQMVLMMMHLGARGLTRREINNCLHLAASPQSNLGNLDKLLQSGYQQQTQAPTTVVANDVVAESSGLKLKRRHQQASSENVKLQTVNGKSQQPANLRHPNLATSQSQQQSPNIGNPHELFGVAVRNLLKDPAVTKALTSANQIFLQKNLPLWPQYEWAIKHYYSADVKLVDFQHQSTSTNTASSGPTALHLGEKSKSQGSADYSNLGPTVINSTSANGTDEHQTNLRELPNNVQQTVNEWVDRQSRGRISNFLSSPVSTSTLMMAINVLYFKGDWQYKFDPSDTETDALFTQVSGKTVKIPMMVNRLPLAFAHDPVMKTSVIELPYKAQRLGLFLLLPDEISGIFHTMQMLNSTSFANLISSMRKPSSMADQAGSGINVRIPKFSIESSPRLSHILSQHLGLKTLFTPDSADLTGMFAPQCYKRPNNASNQTTHIQTRGQETCDGGQQSPLQVGLDELLHKAVLQVDEQGSVAAASSATIVERVGLFNSNYFEADHPFLLFLMDKQTGLVLFSGAFAGNNNDDRNGNNQEAQQRQR